MTDLIWENGENVAWIEAGDVFSTETKKKIATVQDRHVIDLSGNDLGLLYPLEAQNFGLPSESFLTLARRPDTPAEAPVYRREKGKGSSWRL